MSFERVTHIEFVFCVQVAVEKFQDIAVRGYNINRKTYIVSE